MGMAASQARWISLAARKTNVEYEGQQINQARVALSNQSAELWNQLYQMQVPTPPSTADYTKTQYSFESDGTAKTIKDIQSVNYIDEDGLAYNSYVTYIYQANEYTGIQKYNYNPQVHKVTTQVTTGTVTSTVVDTTTETSYQTTTTTTGETITTGTTVTTRTTGTHEITIPVTEDGGEVYMVGTKKLTELTDIINDNSIWPTYQAALDQIAKDKPESEVAKDWIKYRKDPADTSPLSNIYFWSDNSNKVNFTDANGYNGLNACLGEPTRTLYSFYADNQLNNKEIKEYAYIEYDDQGRATSMQLRGSSAVYVLNTESITDEAAYNDAMNKYYYSKQVYEKKVQDINAKTEQIQTEDRTLELRLKALDTEQNALQTEMEAVHKIISKNIENTFKTFEG